MYFVQHDVYRFNTRPYSLPDESRYKRTVRKVRYIVLLI
jgi:hypothetical protein